MPNRKPTPKYRLHKQSGQAVVTLRDAVTAKRRDILLGEYDSQESRERYDAVIAEWLANGRRLHGQPQQAQVKDGIVVAQVALSYLDWAEGYYSDRRLPSIKSVLRVLNTIAADDPVEQFGPNRLREVREEMLRRGWCRRTINDSVNAVRSLFKWAAGRELIDFTIYQRLTAVEPLRKGKTNARESEPVQPVDEAHVEKVKKCVSRQVSALIDLQLLTAARAGEVIGLRLIDIDMSENIWRIELKDHKTAHHGRNRTLYLGPKAQSIVHPFLNRSLDRPLFSPRDAVAEAAAEAPTHRRPDQKPTPRKTTRTIADSYTVAAYRRAIERGCDKAFPSPEPLAVGKGETIRERDARLTDEQHEQLKQWRRDHRFTPHQLRHSAATRIRKEFGLDAAQVVLGHASITMSELYAMADEAKAIEVVKKIG